MFASMAPTLPAFLKGPKDHIYRKILQTMFAGFPSRSVFQTECGIRMFMWSLGHYSCSHQNLFLFCRRACSNKLWGLPQSSGACGLLILIPTLVCGDLAVHTSCSFLAITIQKQRHNRLEADLPLPWQSGRNLVTDPEASSPFPFPFPFPVPLPLPLPVPLPSNSNSTTASKLPITAAPLQLRSPKGCQSGPRVWAPNLESLYAHHLPIPEEAPPKEGPEGEAFWSPGEGRGASPKGLLRTIAGAIRPC